MSIEAIKNEFATRVNPETSYTLVELKKILSDAYKSVNEANKAAKAKAKAPKEQKRTKRERDENGEIIKKRPASAYNLFIKEQSAIIKQDNPTFDSKTIFKMAVAEWKKKKETTSDNSEHEDEPAKPTEQSEQDKTKEPIQAPEEVIPATEEPVAEVKEETEQKSKKTAKKLAKKPKNTSTTDEE